MEELNINPVENMSNKITDSISNKISSKMDESMANIMNNFNEQMGKLANTFFLGCLDFLTVFIYVNMIWACFCMMMGRSKVGIPPFTEVKPVDSLFYNGMFYFIIAIMKTVHGG